MKIPLTQLNGLYLRYTDLAEPVVDLRSRDSVKHIYAFTRWTDRTALVGDFSHVAQLLSSGRYEVVGAEVSLTDALAQETETLTVETRGD